MLKESREQARVIRNAARLRMKESDRIAAMEQELRKMGAELFSTQDTVTVRGGALHGADGLYGHNDHRVVMALAVAAYAAGVPAAIGGAEALVRWQRPGKGLILPGRFIPALEENGLMPLLDCEVLRIVCRDIREAREGGIDPGWVSVNLSQLHAGHYSGEMVGRRAREAVARDRLRFELTETAPRPEGSGEMLDFARRLQEQGFQIAMDDYGTGNSTLKLLHQIPFDILKLDRYFVSRIGAKKSETILKSTISLAKSLGMKVVAEGVETREQLSLIHI